MDINECLQRCISEHEKIPMRPPAAFLTANVVNAAMQVVASDNGFQDRMRANGFDPAEPADALLALAIAFAASQVPMPG